ncbi:MAG: type I restriction-modification system subunit M N-terminal domain-containing protein, partial [Muribaculaceae bacterium]
MFDQTFKNIDDTLRLVCSNELDYVEQSSWILFLKYLHDLEYENRLHAELGGTPYKPIITGEFCWDKWAAPKDASGTPDKKNALTGEDLLDFVNRELFPYLRKFRQTAASPDTI